MIHESRSVADTEAIAARLAESFQGGEVLALHGDLGAGKTQFVRGLVRGLGGEPRAVSSPTYVLLNIYDQGRLAVYHLDAYRTAGPDDMEGIGFSELLEQRAVVAIEWPDRIPTLLPPRVWRIRITPIGENHRQIEIEPPAGVSSAQAK